MSNLRVLYHLARADFLERTRRYSFLIMLGLVRLDRLPVRERAIPHARSARLSSACSTPPGWAA